jgi:hypothetical protein
MEHSGSSSRTNLIEIIKSYIEGMLNEVSGRKAAIFDEDTLGINASPTRNPMFLITVNSDFPCRIGFYGVFKNTYTLERSLLH